MLLQTVKKNCSLQIKVETRSISLQVNAFSDNIHSVVTVKRMTAKRKGCGFFFLMFISYLVLSLVFRLLGTQDQLLSDPPY